MTIQTDAQFLYTLNEPLLQKSKSQLRQDLFVLHELKYLEGGMFVEFGATDGITGSNTWLLENEFAWYGILAEPAKIWHQSLESNRPNDSVDIDKRCVWTESGKLLDFREANAADLSTLESFVDSDYHGASRRVGGNTYPVETVSLYDLLKSYSAWEQIDYLSIDTEGSELDILTAFFSQPNNKYTIDVITVEHNFGSTRQGIYDLLTSKGYKRKLEAVSQWDDFYVREGKDR